MLHSYESRSSRHIIFLSLLFSFLVSLSACSKEEPQKQGNNNQPKTTNGNISQEVESVKSDCLSGCDKIYEEEKNKLKAIHTSEKSAIVQTYKEREIELIEQDQEFQLAQKKAYAELLDPNAELTEICKLYHERVLKIEKSISQEIEKLNLPETSYDQQIKIIEGLKTKSGEAEKEWRECRDNNIKSMPKYGERQKKFLDESKKWAIASTRLNELKDEKRVSLESQKQSQKLDFEWLDKVRDQCKQSGEWSARLGGQLPENCACTVRESLASLAESMQQRRLAEKDFYKATRELDNAWSELNNFMKQKSEDMTPTTTEWIADGINLAISANLTLYDMAAARNLSPKEIAQKVKRVRASFTGKVEKKTYWDGVKSLGSKVTEAYYDGNRSLVTATGKAAIKITPAVKKSIKTWGKEYGKATVKNKDFIASGPKWIQQNLVQISDLQFALANQLTTLISVQQDEELAWQSLLDLPCVKSACAANTNWFSREKYEQLSEAIYGATDTEARQNFIKSAFSQTGPYNQGLLATGRFCDICAAISHLMKLRVFADYARSVHGRTEQHLYEYQQAYASTVDNLMVYLDSANKGVVGNALGDYELAYTATTIVISFWFPWPVLAVAATEAAVNNWGNVTQTIPFAQESALKLRSLSEQMDAKHIDLIYWRNYSRNLDEQLAYMMERTAKCARRECDKPSKPIDVPRDESTQCELSESANVEQGCWRIEEPSFTGDVLFSEQGKEITAQISHGLLESKDSTHDNYAAIDSDKVLEFEGSLTGNKLSLEHTYSRQRLSEVVDNSYPDYLIDKMIELGAKATIIGTIKKDIDYYGAGFQKWDVMEGNYVVLNFAVENYEQGRDSCPEPGIKINNSGSDEVIYSLAYNDQDYCLYKTENRNDGYLINDGYFSIGDMGGITWLKLDPIVSKMTAINIRNTSFDNEQMMERNPIHVGERIWLEVHEEGNNCRFRQDSLEVRLEPEKNPEKAFTIVLHETSKSSGRYRSNSDGIKLEFREKDVLSKGDYGQVKIFIEGAPLYNNMPAHGFVSVKKK